MSLFDDAERLLWGRHDARNRAAGLTVERLGRWHRSYRHPERVAAALARRNAATAPAAGQSPHTAA